MTLLLLLTGCAPSAAAPATSAVPRVASAPLVTGADGCPASAVSERAGDPPERQGFGAAFDTARGQLVLFGGFQRDRYVGDTWTWDGGQWTERHPATHPSPRRNAAMAYDAGHGVVLLYGGNDLLYGQPPGSDLSDTWLWDGSTWILRNSPIVPHLRGAVAVYDERARVVVLTGLRFDMGVMETWSWDGTSWTFRQTGGLPPRAGEAAAYDPLSRKVLLFGGFTQASGTLADAWAWDSIGQWAELRWPTSPGARLNAAMGGDPAHRTLLLFGGSLTPSGPHPCETWSWDGTRWTLLHPPTTPPIVFGQMLYDAAHRRGLLLGEALVSGDARTRLELWTWDGTDWKRT